MPSFTGPLSIFTYYENSNLCFAELFTPEINLNESVFQNLATPKKGIKVSVFGFSPKTWKNNKCGSNANRNLLPLPF